jgi:hypothetical protein
MNDKVYDNANKIFNQKRIEFLLEELIYQTILTRNNSDAIASKQEFAKSMQVVLDSVKEFFQSLPDEEQ